jgi:hypothetical protein
MARKFKGIQKEKEFTNSVALMLGHLVLGFGTFEYGLAGIVAAIPPNGWESRRARDSNQAFS